MPIRPASRKSDSSPSKRHSQSQSSVDFIKGAHIYFHVSFFLGLISSEGGEVRALPPLKYRCRVAQVLYTPKNNIERNTALALSERRLIHIDETAECKIQKEKGVLMVLKTSTAQYSWYAPLLIYLELSRVCACLRTVSLAT